MFARNRAQKIRKISIQDRNRATSRISPAVFGIILPLRFSTSAAITHPSLSRKLASDELHLRTLHCSYGAVGAVLPSPGIGNIAMVLGRKFLAWLFMVAASVRAGIEVNRGEPYSHRGEPRLLDRFYPTENAESTESQTALIAFERRTPRTLCVGRFCV